MQCTDLNCQQCYSNGTCYSCQNSYYLDSTLSCISCDVGRSYCNSCNYDGTICLSCRSLAYYLFMDSCLPCNSPCLTCASGNPNYCLTCDSNVTPLRVLDKNAHKCVDCNSIIKGCVTCAISYIFDPSGAIACYECIIGYTLINGTNI